MHTIIFYSILSILNVFTVFIGAEELYPRYTLTKDLELPQKFRTSQTPYRKELNCNVTREGLDQLRISGSAQYSDASFRVLLSRLDAKKLVILDLRGEFHGFLNGSNVYWKGKGSTPYSYLQSLTTQEIEAKERIFLLELLGQEVAKLDTNEEGPINSPVRTIQTESQLVKGQGFQYYRIPIVHGKRPTDREVDNILALYKITSPKSWIHVHCAGGKIRTTMVMSMLDIMSNSHLPLETILRRQEAIGGVNLYDPKTYPPEKAHKSENGKERLAFLKLFQRYCIENPYFLVTWSSWVAKQNINK